MNRRSSGFTLIELLIVVAIIGILAAIAIPNFLNAQIRAKVARVKSELRLIGTAMEMYYTDEGHYLCPEPRLESRPGLYQCGQYLVQLTEPIPYISKFPDDPFRLLRPTAPQKDYRYNVRGVDLTGAEPGRWDVNYFHIFGTSLQPGEYAGQVRYAAFSWGPIAIAPHILLAQGQTGFEFYDPTNGTVSVGTLNLWGPGVMPHQTWDGYLAVGKRMAQVFRQKPYSSELPESAIMKSISQQSYLPGRGFTLIELLIVVAIIGILAAIAIPNFLEAQIRAKVSQSKANLRTLATAMEAYYIDYNHYPLDHEWIYPYFERWTQVTTPIAYITSVPGDPFANEEVIRNYPWPAGNPYPLTTGEYPPVLAYAHALRLNASGGYDLLFNIIFERNSMEWLMRGIGPDQNPMWLGGGEPGYDPSNGTMSRGQIHWVGPGGGEIAPVRYYP